MIKVGVIDFLNLQKQEKNKKIIRNSVKVTKKNSDSLKNEIQQYLDSNGYLSFSAKKKKYIILGTNSPRDGIAQCPECKIGQLMIIRSPSTKKRFIGCSNYNNGCNASSPLLQKARLRAIKSLCTVCAWPMIVFRYSNKQKWSKQCANFKCKSRIKPSKV